MKIASPGETRTTITPSEVRLARIIAAFCESIPASTISTVRRETPEQIPAERLKLVSADIRFLSQIVGQLTELRQAPEEDEYGTLRATRFAYEAACELLTDTAIVLAIKDGRQIPYGCASTDAEGGVRIEWIRDNRSVHLVIPADGEKPAYIYYEAGEKFGTASANPEHLARFLVDID